MSRVPHRLLSVAVAALLLGCGSDLAPPVCTAPPAASPPGSRLTVQGVASDGGTRPDSLRGAVRLTVNVGRSIVPTNGGVLELRNGTALVVGTQVGGQGTSDPLPVTLAFEASRLGVGAQLVTLRFLGNADRQGCPATERDRTDVALTVRP